MTPLPQQLEDKKKEQYEVGELMNLDVDRYTFSKQQEERVSEILDYHIETVEKFNKIGNTDLTIDLENKYNILEAEIAILEQAIAEIKNIQSQKQNMPGTEANLNNSRTSQMGGLTPPLGVQTILQKQRQEILDWVKEHEFTQNQGGYLIYADDLETYIQQLNQPKTENDN